MNQEFEWQATIRSHSPRTPTPPAVMKTLHETPPPLSEPREWVTVDHVVLTAEVARERLREHISRGLLVSLRGDAIVFADGVSVSKGQELFPGAGIDMGSTWLVLAARVTYDSSQLASLLISRKGLTFVSEPQRSAIIAYFSGSVTEEVLAVVGLLTSSHTESSISDKNYIVQGSLRAKRISLDTTRKAIDQLKKRIAELENKLKRMKVKPPAQPATASASTASKLSKESVTEALQSVMKRKAKPVSTPVPPPALAVGESSPGGRDPEMRVLLEAELRMMLDFQKQVIVEWQRVGSKCREFSERKAVLERRVTILKSHAEEKRAMMMSPQDAVGVPG